MFQVNKKILNNGLRVVAVPMENTSAVTFLVAVGVGSRYESKKINGISHFLEHLFFKGTKKRPKPGQIHKELDILGASHNAFTSKEETAFWVKASSKDFDKVLDIIADILLNPIFPPEEIEKERGVIIQEINMYEDDPKRKVYDVLEEIMYKNHPLGRDIAGTKEIISAIKREEIIEYKNKNYLSKNIVVGVAGNIDKDRVFKRIKEYFEKVPAGKNKPFLKIKEGQKFPEVKIIHKDIDQTHFALGVRAYNMFDKRRYALKVLTTILGGNFSSILVTEIREKLGLAYYVFAWPDFFMDCGYLGMAAGVGHDKLEKAIKKIMAIIEKIKTKGVSKKDLEHAKSYIRGQTALRFESSDAVAGFVADQELFYKEIKTPDEILKEIEKVSKDDILKVARDIFRPGKINLAVIGNHKDSQRKEEYYKKLLSQI